MSGFFVLLSLFAVMLWNSYVNATSDVLGRFRRAPPLPEADPSYQPFVSLHIAAYNEPPDMLIETIRRAEAMDYPHFEIVVVDNNTKDPAVWPTVEEYCRDRPASRSCTSTPGRGSRRVLSTWSCASTPTTAKRSSDLISTDDFVVPHYLKETAPYFSDERIGFLQSFEGNRDYEGSPYYTACVDSYQAFYLTNMSSRNERNSIPFVGTMGLFRRSALEQAGGWNEWCICEDAKTWSTCSSWAGPGCTSLAASATGSYRPPTRACVRSATAGASEACRSCACTGATCCIETLVPTTACRASNGTTT